MEVALWLIIVVIGGEPMSSKLISVQFMIGAVLGSVIACSPTKFSNAKQASDLCDSGISNCVVQEQSIDIIQNF